MKAGLRVEGSPMVGVLAELGGQPPLGARKPSSSAGGGWTGGRRHLSA